MKYQMNCVNKSEKVKKNKGGLTKENMFTQQPLCILAKITFFTFAGPWLGPQQVL